MAKRSKKKKGPLSAREILPVKPTPNAGQLLWQVLAMVAAALWIYWPALYGDWLWDDIGLVTTNTELRSLHGLGEIWLAAPTTDYWPLSWTLFWIEWHLWGNEPLGYHLCSLALHISSGLLIWRLFDRLGLRWGWFGGFLFVVHPLAVESVAWISEIKNTLSLPFFLLSLDAWLDAEEKRPLGHLKSVLYYLAALLAKTSTVMLPAVLLLYCWWKRGRISRREVIRMIPYGGIALVLGLITIYFQNHGHDEQPIALGGGVARALTAGTALCFYLGKFILPLDLMPIYPSWNLARPSLLQLLTLPVLIALLFVLWVNRKGWGRHVIFGFGFFLLNLLPVLGLLKMRYMAVSWVADHLVYLPMIGLIGLVVAGLGQLQQRIPSFLYLYGAGAISMVMVLLAWESRSYASQFSNEETLWTYTLRQDPQAWMPHKNLGTAFLQAGRMTEAMEQFKQAVQINPNDAGTYMNWGAALMQADRAPEAIEQFEQVLKVDPEDADAHYNLGAALMQVERMPEAIEQLELTLKINPDSTNAHYSLGCALMHTGRMTDAIEQFEQVLKINPEDAEAHTKLGMALGLTGHESEAVEQFEQALKINPDDAAARAILDKIQALQQAAPAKK